MMCPALTLSCTHGSDAIAATSIVTRPAETSWSTRVTRLVVKDKL